MISLERTVETNKPVDLVAAYLSDFSTTEQWDPGTVRCRRLRPAVGTECGVGAEYESVSSFRGRETKLRYKTVQYEPGRHVRLVGENKAVKSIDDMRFEPYNGGTRVTYHVDFEFKGLARLAGPLLKSPLNKLGDEAAKGMKHTLDDLPA